MFKIKKIIKIFPAGLFFGFITAFTLAIIHSGSHKYMDYRLYRLMFITLKNDLNKGIIYGIVIALFLVVLSLLFHLFSKLISMLSLGLLSLFKYKKEGRLLKTIPLSYSKHKLIEWKHFEKLAQGFVTVYIIVILLLNFILFLDRNIASPLGSNVILIVIDTLRSDHVSCYGYNRQVTPNIDLFAKDAILFKNAISPAPWTTPTIGTIFTSQYPSELGIFSDPVIMRKSSLTLSEMFRESNYHTVGIISHLYISSKLGFGQGFDKYNEERIGRRKRLSAPFITNHAIQFLRKQKNKKFFMFLHYFDPHYNYYLHPNFNFYPQYQGKVYSGQSIKELRRLAPSMIQDDLDYIHALYDSEICFTDMHMEILINELKSLKLYDDTMIIITADHGEEFCERNDFWIGHSKKLYQELIHIPLIIKLPGKTGPAVREDYVGLIDLMPTILNEAGIQIPDNYKVNGRKLFSGNQKNCYIISETYRFNNLRSVIRDGWKYIHNPKIGYEMLFNLEKDPYEKNNLIQQKPTKKIEMQNILNQWVKERLNQDQDFNKPEFSEEEKAHLKSLGYL